MAQDQTGVVMGMFSTVALFTALFTILSTLSMGMVERIGQMGTLRCLGMTRFQMAMLVLAEALPTGIVGILLGIPVGLGLARMSVWLAPEYIGELSINKTGVAAGPRRRHADHADRCPPPHDAGPARLALGSLAAAGSATVRDSGVGGGVPRCCHDRRPLGHAGHARSQPVVPQALPQLHRDWAAVRGATG